MKNFFKKYFLVKWRIILLLILFGFINLIISIIEPNLFSKILSIFQSNFTLEQIFVPIGLLLCLKIFSNLINMLKNKAIFENTINISQEIETNLSRHLSNVPLDIISSKEPEKLSGQIREASNIVQKIFELFEYFWCILLGVFVLFYSLVICWQIFICYLLSLCVLIIFQLIYFHKLTELAQREIEDKFATNQFLREVIQAFTDILFQGMFVGLKSIFMTHLDLEKKSTQKVMRKKNMLSFICCLCQTISTAVFLMVSAFLLVSNQISIETVLLLYIYRNYITSLGDGVLRLNVVFSSIKASYSLIDEIFSLPKKRSGNLKLYHSFNKDDAYMHLKNINYKNILHNISLDLPPTGLVTIVGKSGSGKSTLCKILTGELMPSSGKIMFGERNLNELDYHSLRKVVKMLSQFPLLFSNKTIRSNLSMACPNISDSEILEALKKVNADKLVQRLGGLDATLKPECLSGGEKQKLALTRLILNKAQIMILDESTSAMDNLSKSDIIKLIKDGAQYFLIIFVTHTLDLAKIADQILVIEDGHIVDNGKYTELSTNSKNFIKLFGDNNFS